jgi:hypothetical protein
MVMESMVLSGMYREGEAIVDYFILWDVSQGTQQYDNRVPRFLRVAELWSVSAPECSTDAQH